MPIPEDSTASSWYDGDITLVTSILMKLKFNVIEVFHNNKVITKKHNKSRIGVDQAADAAEVFLMLKKLEDTYTVSDLPTERCPIKRIVQQKFIKLYQEQRLDFKANAIIINLFFC